MADKVRENRLRRWAARYGWRITKSRVRLPYSSNRGQYRLSDNHDIVIEGDSFEATLDLIERTLADEHRRWTLAIHREPLLPAWSFASDMLHRSALALKEDDDKETRH